MRILFTGGGTGGHFFPILAVARELKRIAEEERILDLELYYMGPDDFGKEILAEEDVRVIRVSSGKVRRYFSWLNFIDFFRMASGVLWAIWHLFFLMPDVIFSKGGYGALPAVSASALFRIPLVIHESDAVPGKVNQFSARFAARIALGFAGAEQFFPKEKTALVGVPIRKRILGGNREEAKETLGIFSQLPIISIIGASQGAQPINEVVLDILKELTADFEVLHQTGANNLEDVKSEAAVILKSGQKDRYHPFGFLNEADLRNFYNASDFIISRASASSIFEIAAWGKPSIMIPLSHAAQDHQRGNGYEYAAAGACVVIEEENLTPHILLAEIKKALADPERLKRMGESAQRFARIDAAEVVAREILKMGLHR